MSNKTTGHADMVEYLHKSMGIPLKDAEKIVSRLKYFFEREVSMGNTLYFKNLFHFRLENADHGVRVVFRVSKNLKKKYKEHQ